MPELDIPVTPQIRKARVASLSVEPLLGLGIGVLGGAVQSMLLATPVSTGIVYGASFGLLFGLFFSRRATSPGAGLIWGVATALLLWIVLPAGILPLRHSGDSLSMLNDARASFPQLVAFLICLGMPVGVTLGIWGEFHSRANQPKFSWGRAIVAGGLAGTIAGFIFGLWVSSGNYFPLLAGYGEPASRTATLALHFAHRAPDRCHIRHTLSTRRARLRLLDGLGSGLRDILVVSRSAYPFASGCRLAA